MMKKIEIVADGSKRRIDTKAVSERRRELKTRFEGKYSEEMKLSSWFKRIMIRDKIRRVIDRTIDEEYQQSLYNLNGRVKR